MQLPSFSNHFIIHISNSLHFSVHAQPNYHSGQRVTHKGGYSIYFDLKTKQWSEAVPFDALTTDEHIDEMVFVHENQICCLLYSNVGKIEFTQLAIFDVNERQFSMWNEFEVSVSGKLC